MSASQESHEGLAEIMARVAAGEPEAVKEFMTELLLLMRARLKFSSVPAEQREDAQQQLCLWLLKQVVAICQKYDPSMAKPVYFLTPIVDRGIKRFQRGEYAGKNQIFHQSRQKSSSDGAMNGQEQALQEALDWSIGGGAFAPSISEDERLIAKEEVAFFRKQLRDHSELDLQIFERHFMLEQKAEEVCSALELKPNAFYKRVERLRDKLRKILEKFAQQNGFIVLGVVGILFVLMALGLGFLTR